MTTRISILYDDKHITRRIQKMGKEGLKLPILGRDNYEGWFRRAVIKLNGKDIGFAIHETLEDHAWVALRGGALPQPPAGQHDTRTQAQIAGGEWDREKVKEWSMGNAKALALILDGLDENDDANLLDEFQTARQV